MDKWGPDIWNYIHTYTVLIKNDLFYTNKDKICSHLYAIATQLPCPLCSDHAIKYLNKHKLKNIKSKQDLVMLFFNFHNEVNRRKNKPLYQHNKLEKYKLNDINHVANNYIKTWLQGMNSRHLSYNNNFTNKLHFKYFKKWYWENIDLVK